MYIYLSMIVDNMHRKSLKKKRKKKKVSWNNLNKIIYIYKKTKNEGASYISEILISCIKNINWFVSLCNDSNKGNEKNIKLIGFKNDKCK